MKKFTIAIHGGAGTILKSEMTAELEDQYRAGLRFALNAGYKILEDGGSAIEAVKRAVMTMEDNILFNAGRGSVFTKNGIHEMDASIMNGATLEAGAVAAVRNIRNPIEFAEQVMLHSGHVFLAGEGAHDFAKKHGIKTEPDEYFFSQYRYDQWKAIRDTDEFRLDHSAESADKIRSTVGAVACDRNGNIGAATSTGGMTNKQFGRIGDSPMIGAGTYANNKTCAVSCTGYGEIFIRTVAAYDVSCLMEYKKLNLEEACNEVVMGKLLEMGGDGGLIAVDAEGNSSLIFNSEGMYRAIKSSDGSEFISIYKD